MLTPPISARRYWDAKTSGLLRFLIVYRTHADLLTWAKENGLSHDLINMLAYLEDRERAAGDGLGWQRKKKDQT